SYARRYNPLFFLLCTFFLRLACHRSLQFELQRRQLLTVGALYERPRRSQTAPTVTAATVMFLPSPSCGRRSLRALDLCASEHWYACAARARVVRGDAGARDTRRFPSNA